MTYVATALARGDQTWSGGEVDLDETEDLDGVIDVLRDLSVDGAAVLLLVEENDEWFGIVRVEGDAEPRCFLSDARVLEQSDLAVLLFEDAPGAEVEGEDEESSISAEGDPAGDPDLLVDLGTPAKELFRLCGEKGMLPSDVLAAICERAGCLDQLEELRGA